MVWTPRVPPFKVIGTDTDRSATYDCLLVIHSNYGPISYRFRAKRRIRSKVAKCSHLRVFNFSAMGLLLEFYNNGWVQKVG